MLEDRVSKGVGPILGVGEEGQSSSDYTWADCYARAQAGRLVPHPKCRCFPSPSSWCNNTYRYSQIFANHEEQRSWIIEEILSSLIKLSDTKQKAGQFRFVHSI